jgi:hypothetical protein
LRTVPGGIPRPRSWSLGDGEVDAKRPAGGALSQPFQRPALQVDGRPHLHLPGSGNAPSLYEVEVRLCDPRSTSADQVAVEALMEQRRHALVERIRP